jgi:hypothetical protein
MMNWEGLNLATPNQFCGMAVIGFLLSKDYGVDETEGNWKTRFEERKIRMAFGACFHEHRCHWIEFCFGCEDSGFPTTSQRRHGAAVNANASAARQSNRQPAGYNKSNPDSHATIGIPRCHANSD